MTMRRALIAMSAVATAAGFGMSSAQAAVDYPVCLHVYGPVTYDECAYTSIEQCRPVASGLPAQCLMNPFYHYNVEKRWPPRRPHRR